MAKLTPAPETVTLYRAVEPAEHRSIMRTGRFSWGPRSTDMKQFGCDEQEVRTFAQWLGSPAIVKVVVLRSAVAGADFSRTIDPHIFKSGVYTFNSGNLDEMNDGILSIHTC